MTSSRAEALMLLPDWARRLSAKGAVDFTETLQGTWRRDGEELDRPIQLVLRHTATSARRLLESGAMETEGEVSLDGVTSQVRGTRGVSWRTGRVDIDLVSDGFHFIGGLHNLLWRGEPHRFRIETLAGAPVGDAILRPRRTAEAEVRATQSAAP
ncbi:MAG TPA: hypothetical protein VLT82_17335 [Myxococcaceae bacterium]|nr:hypothetical protein [Myxococcaceae bacterium]